MVDHRASDKGWPGLVMAALLAFPSSSSHSSQPPSVVVLDVGVALHCVVHWHWCGLSAFQSVAVIIPSSISLCKAESPHPLLPLSLSCFFVFIIRRCWFLHHSVPAIISRSSIIDQDLFIHLPLHHHPLISSFPTFGWRLSVCSPSLSSTVHRYLSLLPCIAACSFLRYFVGARLRIVSHGCVRSCVAESMSLSKTN